MSLYSAGKHSTIVKGVKYSTGKPIKHTKAKSPNSAGMDKNENRQPDPKGAPHQGKGK